MASTLINGAAPAPDLLACYVQKAGILTDPTAISWKLINLVTGATIAQNADVLVSGKVTTGVYKVDWTPAATVVRAIVEWTYTLDSVVYTLIRRFEVLTGDGTIRSGLTLALAQDINDKLTTPATASVAWQWGQRWTSLIERVTRQHFRPIRETRRMRGTGGSVLFLPEPLFAAASLSVEGSAIGSTLFYVYGATGRERTNPRIELLSEVRDIFRSSISSRFYEAHRVEVSGVWGYFDVDSEWDATSMYLEPPREIIEAAALGASLSITEASGTSSGAVAAGNIKKEKTDGHEIEYAVAPPQASRAGLSDLLKDPEIRDALALYRAPIAIAAPAG